MIQPPARSLLLLGWFLVGQISPSLAEDLETGSDRRVDGVASSFGSAVRQVDLFSGSASHTVPVEVPVGPGGFAPTLYFHYHSDRGNGRLGIGWELGGLHRIERSSKYGIPTYSDPQPWVERFSSQDLDRFDLYLHGQHYELFYDAGLGRFRTDPQAHLRISFTSTPSGISRWLVVDKAGVRYSFVGIPAVGREGYRFYPVREATDPNDNLIRYDYDVDTRNGDYYPQRITYGLTRRPVAYVGAVTVSIELETELRLLPSTGEVAIVSDYRGGVAHGNGPPHPGGQGPSLLDRSHQSVRTRVRENSPRTGIPARVDRDAGSEV